MDEERIKNLEELSETLSYTFNDIKLLDISLSHSSYANENPDLAGKTTRGWNFWEMPSCNYA